MTCRKSLHRDIASFVLSFAGLWIAGFPAVASAHPHIFVDAKFEAVAAADGSLSELRNTWRFDEVFSSSVLLDFDKNNNSTLDPPELAAVAKYNYYTSATIYGKAVPLTKPDVIHTTYEGGSLILSFSQRPTEKTPLRGLIVFGVYDPTLYTALDFANDTDLKTSGDGFRRCKSMVIRPESKEIRAENQATLTSLFFNDPMGTGYSQLVATRLEVQC
ncbi:DUF1007 family protein [Rhizobium mesoamericanum]|uniref:Uncharacterized protein n=1 Tax=Rhizobium mesoamericanum STM3625 TaxID=1211777 RepID=K0Q5P7_9HYPH|nr:DUF1007 family protein [Rhizobium mesoamericanum]CCM78749.1 conserved exported hypothetical protein [Rhizobium mesoamericanum STM3625]